MQTAAAYRKSIGIIDSSGVRHKIDGSASLKVGDLSELATAAYIFGAAGIGVQIPSCAESQFDNRQVWSVVANDPIEGGHYVPCVGRDANGNYLFITWGKVQPATPQWVQTYMDEGLCYLDLEVLNSKGLSPESYDAAVLQSYLGEL
jgi:hypothetical protein